MRARRTEFKSNAQNAVTKFAQRKQVGRESGNYSWKILDSQITIINKMKIKNKLKTCILFRSQNLNSLK